jgi:hypothetical protein
MQHGHMNLKLVFRVSRYVLALYELNRPMQGRKVFLWAGNNRKSYCITTHCQPSQE